MPPGGALPSPGTRPSGALKRLSEAAKLGSSSEFGDSRRFAQTLFSPRLRGWKHHLVSHSMARRGDDREIIDLCDSDDDMVLDDPVTASRRNGAGPAAGAAAHDEEDDEAFARRLQEQEWSQGPHVPPPPTFAPSSRRQDTSVPLTAMDHARYERQEQDAEYKASLAADRKRELEQQAAEKAKRDAEAAARAEAAAAAAVAQAAATAAEQTVQRKEDAKNRWLAVPEPQAGVSLMLRFSDGTRLQRKFAASDTLHSLFEAVAALGPLPLDANFTLAFGFPRVTVTRDAANARTLSEVGVDGAVMVTIE